MIYLYVKQHPITGLKYFGKTIRKDPFRYQGSGKYWLNHIKTHGGKGIRTLSLFCFNELQEASAFAMDFSRQHDIVASDQWANLVEETAIDSCVGGHRGHKHTEETKARIAAACRARNIKPMLGRTPWNKGIPRSEWLNSRKMSSEAPEIAGKRDG